MAKSKYDNMPDMCQTCEADGILKTTYPTEIKRDNSKKRGSGLIAYYTCDRGHTWNCYWSGDHWRD